MINSFWLKRIHSLTGFFLLLFFFEHILTNSQATLFLGEDGKGFLDGVDLIHSFPYLPMIEIFFIATPMIIHMILGVKYILTTKYNSLPYWNNHAFTWQRLTAWILLVGVCFHVYQMRFDEQPLKFQNGEHTSYLTHLTIDDGLHTISKRLNFEIYTKEKIDSFAKGTERLEINGGDKPKILQAKQEFEKKIEFANLLQKKPLKKNQVIAVSEKFSTSILLIVRNAFKSPTLILLYAIFVLAASFHALNGLRTFLITWGVTLSEKSQKMTWGLVIMIMLGMISLGFVALGAYYLNLYN